MVERQSLSEYKEEITKRLHTLAALSFPQFRSYRKPDGTWVDKEPVPEHIECEDLCRIWYEITDFENWFHREKNRLIISLRLRIIGDALEAETVPIDLNLQARIAQSVYTNAPAQLVQR